MIYAEYHFPSDILGRSTMLRVLLPRQRNLICPEPKASLPTRFPCLWLLHGLGDDSLTVLNGAGLGELCDARGLAILLPDVGNSFCLNTQPDSLYRSYLLEELIPFTLEALPLSPKREEHLLGGISMGGYGACALGLARPELFSRVLVLSGALDLKFAQRYARLTRIPLPTALAEADLSLRPDWDPLVWLETGAPDTAPAFYLACGTRDLNRHSAAAFAERGKALGYDCTLSLTPGRHDWRYWRETLPEALDWALAKLAD